MLSYFMSVAWLLVPCLALIAPSAVVAQDSQATAAPEARSAELDGILERFEAAGDGLKSLRADLEYTVIQLIKENEDDPDEFQKYIGTVTLARSADNTRSLIHFKKWTAGETWDKNQQWFLFDGRTLYIAKEVAKTVEQRQIVGPDEQIDPFKIGEGPFPLPFGQKKADVLAQFDVTVAVGGPDDPAHTDHIICRPKANTELAEEYEYVELYISKRTGDDSFGLPLKIIAKDLKEQVRKVVVFSALRKNQGLQPPDVQLPPQTRAWQSL